MSQSGVSQSLPPLWHKIFAGSAQHAVALVKDAWRDIFGKRLSLTIDAFDDLLQSVELITHETGFAILYTLADGRHYIGYAPDTRHKAQDMCQSHTELRTFYTTMHDGWVEMDTDAMGPLPLAQWQKLDEMGWELSIGMVVPPNVYTVFSSGGGGYLCLSPNAAGGLIWFDDDTPELDVDFLDVLDEWITMGLRD